MKRKRLLVGTLLVGSVLGGSWLFGPGRATAAGGEAGQAPPAPEIPVTEVTVRQLAETVEVTGVLAPVENVALRARVSGYVESIAFPEGGLVKKGQLLVQLDPAPFEANLARARAELRRAEERASLAELKMQRTEKLLAGKVASQATYDGTASERGEAKAMVEAARAAVRAAELELGYTRVVSPIDGRVGQALVRPGNLVSGGTDGGTLLTTIVSVDPIHVNFDVDEPTFLRLSANGRRDARGRIEGVPVFVGLADEEGHPHEASLDFLGNHLDPSSGTARARAILANADQRLSPGLFARVRLPTGAPKETVLIPDRAVGTDQSGRYVLTVDGKNLVQPRPVELGSLIDGMRVIRSGLQAGDRVVLGAMVRPGMEIKPRLEKSVVTAEAQP